MPKDDPTELFDLCDRDGVPLGRSKARGLVHRDGDWHRSVHLWVVFAHEGGLRVVLQRRSLAKDTHPGKVDVSVAGHLNAGEPVDGRLSVVREAREEIGLALSPGDLVHVGTRRREDKRDGRLDRELQEIFSVVTPRQLADLRPDPDEVLGLVSLRLDAALRLVTGEIVDALASELRAADGRVASVVLRREELLLAADRYFERALTSLARRLAGAPDRPFSLG